MIRAYTFILQRMRTLSVQGVKEHRFKLNHAKTQLKHVN